MNIAVIILDMAKGYGWAPGSYGYDMVANVRAAEGRCVCRRGPCHPRQLDAARERQTSATGRVCR